MWAGTLTAVMLIAATASWLLSRGGAAGQNLPPPIPLTSYPGYEMRGSLSPDGTQVAFDWTRKPGDTRVYVKLVGAGEPVRLTSSNALELNPVWSPDGRHIAFLRTDSAARMAVYTTPTLGGIERKLAEFPWSRDFTLMASEYSPHCHRGRAGSVLRQRTSTPVGGER
jgi:hypothetical protein